MIWIIISLMNWLEDSELRFVENIVFSALKGQSTHEDIVKKFGLRRILLHQKSGLRRTFSIKILFLIIRGCISFQVSYSVYQFISSENDLNSHTEWSQWHNLYQTVITKVLENKPWQDHTKKQLDSTVTAYRFWRFKLLALRDYQARR